jgi:hypothetical protein
MTERDRERARDRQTDREKERRERERERWPATLPFLSFMVKSWTIQVLITKYLPAAPAGVPVLATHTQEHARAHTYTHTRKHSETFFHRERE